MPDRADRSKTQASASAVRNGLRELTANLLRVARGAGAPELILSQTTALAGCFAAYREACGEDPCAEDITDALRLEDIPDAEGGAWPEWDRAVREMVNGSLQVAAAQLLAQHAQAAAGRRELFAGYRLVEKIHSKQLRRVLRR